VPDVPLWLKIAAAVATVAGGIATVLALVSSGPSPPVPTPSGGATTPVKASSPTATATTGGGSGVSGSDGSAAIYHQGPLTLAFDTCADLDAPPTDRQWGEPSANPDSGGADLCSQSPSFVGVNGATLVAVNSGTDSICQNATGWLTPNLYQDLHLSIGSFVCVHTNQDRYSLLRVEAIDSNTNAITFWVKTFKKPGD
jgi:hypothetical protein